MLTLITLSLPVWATGLGDAAPTRQSSVRCLSGARTIWGLRPQVYRAGMPSKIPLGLSRGLCTLKPLAPRHCVEFSLHLVAAGFPVGHSSPSFSRCGAGVPGGRRRRQRLG